MGSGERLPPQREHQARVVGAEPARIRLPARALVVLVGATGAGKSTFARRCFRATEVVSSDASRAAVADDENALDAGDDAFRVLHTIASARLSRGLLTVIDATNLHVTARRPLLAMARRHGRPAVAIVLDVDEPTLLERAAARGDRHAPAHVVRGHHAELRRTVARLTHEGFGAVHVLGSPQEIDAAAIEIDDAAAVAGPPAGVEELELFD